MHAHEIDKTEGSEEPSVVVGAYADLGARKRGALVFFGVYAPYAESVYLVGAFNSWNETHPMVRIGDGVWEIGIDHNAISDRDAYKYKIYIEGQAVYLTDPYALETDGEPNYNSIYREIEDIAPEACTDKMRVGCVEEPLNIYHLRADRWLVDKNGNAVDYERLAKELLPYVLQMGYTHVNISGILEEYYDFSEFRHSSALFAPKVDQGGVDALRTFMDIMHKASVGVLIDWYIGKTLGDEDADIAFLTENAVYWIDCYGADGLVVNGINERSNEFLRMLVHSIKTERKSICLIAEGVNANDTGVDITVSTPEKYFELFEGVDMLEKETCSRASAMTYLLFEDGRMLTHMGYEIGQADLEVGLERERLNDYCRSRFQLFCSELNYAYLSYPSFWECSECPNTLSKYEFDGVRMLKRRTCDGEFIFACNINGRGGEMKISERGEWRLIFDSDKILGINGNASLQRACGATFLKLPAYGSAVLKKEK